MRHVILSLGLWLWVFSGFVSAAPPTHEQLLQRALCVCSLPVTNAQAQTVDTAGFLIGVQRNELGQRYGLVVTCAHLVPCEPWETSEKRRFAVQFARDTTRYTASPVFIDWPNDILILLTLVPEWAETVPLTDVDPVPGHTYTAYTCAPDLAKTSGVLDRFTSLAWDGGDTKDIPAEEPRRFVAERGHLVLANVTLKPGFSGGPVLAADGTLVGVVHAHAANIGIATSAITVTNTLRRGLPPRYRWVCPPMAQSRAPAVCPPPTYSHPQQPVYQQPAYQQPEYRQPEYVTPTTQQPTSGTEVPTEKPAATMVIQDDSVEESLRRLENLQQQCVELTKKMQRLEDQQSTMLAQSATLQTEIQKVPTYEHMTELLTTIQSQIHATQQAVTQIPKDQTITLNVESTRYISPSYVDVSVLWALQQETGVDHMILIVDTSREEWQTLKTLYETAKQKFPAITLYDVRGENVTFKELPQLALYPLTEGEKPIVLSGLTEVSKSLQLVTQQKKTDVRKP